MTNDKWNKLSMDEKHSYTQKQFNKLNFEIKEFLIYNNVIIGGDGYLWPNKVILTIYPNELALCLPTKKNPYGYVESLKLSDISLNKIKKLYKRITRYDKSFKTNLSS